MGVDAVMRVSLSGERPTDEQIERWADAIRRTFGVERFAFRRGPMDVVPAFALPTGATDVPWCVDVNLCTRYYGPSYERGDPLFLCGVAEWLEQNVPGCTVWYGADSDDVDHMQRFDEPARKAMRAHFYGPNGRAYYARPEGKT